jgi:hypothetical protein
VIERITSMETTIGLINALGDLLNKSAAALSALGDSIAHLAKLGTEAYDALSARKTLNNLMLLRRDLEGMTSGLNETSVGSPIDYFFSAAETIMIVPKRSKGTGSMWSRALSRRRPESMNFWKT